jgi:uncharacterized protein (UPF0248 family)
MADSVISDNNKYTTNTITYLLDVFSRIFTKMKWHYTTTHEIDTIIKSIKMKNSTGYDEISIRIIESSAPFIMLYWVLAFFQID